VLDHAVCPLQAVVELQLPLGEVLVFLVGLEDPVLQGVGGVAQQHVLLCLPHEVLGRVGAQAALPGQRPQAGALQHRTVLHAAGEGGREAPAGAEDAHHVLQLLLIGQPEVEGLQQQDNGVAHLPDAGLHRGRSHTKERAEGLILHVGGQVPQSHGHPLLQGQGGVEVGAVRRQPGPLQQQDNGVAHLPDADVEEGLSGHPELLQPVLGPELLQDHLLPPVGTADAGPGTGVEVAAGSPPASDQE
ncbi:hypothetical protein N320_07728, partial [Buceros rhinoceros silvestris]